MDGAIGPLKFTILEFHRQKQDVKKYQMLRKQAAANQEDNAVKQG